MRPSTFASRLLALLAMALVGLAACSGEPRDPPPLPKATRTFDDHLHQASVALAHAVADPATLRDLHARALRSARAGAGEYVPLLDVLGDQAPASAPASAPLATGPSPRQRFLLALESTEALHAAGVAADKAESAEVTEALLRDIPLEVFWPNAEAWDGATIPTVTYAPEEAGEEIQANHGLLLSSAVPERVVVDDAYVADRPVLVLKVREDLLPQGEIAPQDAAVVQAAPATAAAAANQFAIGSIKVNSGQRVNVFGRKAARAFVFAIAPSYTVVGGKVQFPAGTTWKLVVTRYQDTGSYVGVFAGLGTWTSATQPKHLIAVHRGAYTLASLRYHDTIAYNATIHAGFRWWIKYVVYQGCNGIDFDAALLYGFPDCGESRRYPQLYWKYLTHLANLIPETGYLGGGSLRFIGGHEAYWSNLDIPAQIVADANYAVVYAGNDRVLDEVDLSYATLFGTRTAILPSTTQALGSQVPKPNPFAEQVDVPITWKEADIAGNVVTHRIWITLVSYD